MKHKLDINWNKYPKLASIFQNRPDCNVYWDELKAFVEEYTTDLTFNQLRHTNLARCMAVFHPNGSLEDWSYTDWACALAGEAGEVCNDIKKLRRLDDKTPYYEDEKKRLRKRAAIEVADVVLYADLLTARLGYTLESVVKEKFNEVSEKRGSAIKLR